MTKQEFMAMSLPYGLKVFCNEDSNPYRDYDHARYGMEFFKNEYSYTPILRPLSDLTKEIEHNVEKLVPIVELAKMRSSIVENVIPMAFEAIKRDIKSKRLPFDMVLKLIEWHFDIANLIESGEAIDINTLETNPYK